MIKTYSEFSESKLAKETALSKEVVAYYTEKQVANVKYDVGDIVFVCNYK